MKTRYRLIVLLLFVLFSVKSSLSADIMFEKATFAGGCFWCMEPPFEELDGVLSVTSGYTGGREKNPTYHTVSSGATGHAEAIEIHYDPAKIDYARLIDIFWRNIDPTQVNGQFTDKGKQYRTAIFYHNEEQEILAQESKRTLAQSGKFNKPIVTEIVPAGHFYPAEEYHQDYYKKNPDHYKSYHSLSGREPYLRKAWGRDDKNKKTNTNPDNQKWKKMSPQDLREKLTPLQYQITQESRTEKPFKNEYWNNEEDGIYVDIVSGEPLFSSTDKFPSGTGWPSFTRPLEPDNILEKKDNHLFMRRTEVRSKHGDSHLGHVFDDGPPPTGIRYCLNSAALRFIPKKELEQEGYAQYKKLFTVK